MKLYPYIGKVEAEGGSSILIKSSKNVGYIIKNNLDDALEGVWEGGYNGDAHIKNITAEYLANTYGEVKSKEHAEFIKLLAETNKVPCDVVSIDMNYTMFYVIDGCLFFCVKEIDVVGDYKQITIPLPPECEGADEWPKVGDDVETKHDSGQVLKGELLAITNEYAIIQQVGHEQHLHLSAWKFSKPKTPEQELRDELSDLAFNQFNDDSYDLTHNSYYLAEQILSKYNVTKKPQ